MTDKVTAFIVEREFGGVTSSQQEDDELIVRGSSSMYTSIVLI